MLGILNSPQTYPHLFAPGAIGRVTIANRIVQTPMGTALMDMGRVTEREVAFQEERARNGVGLIVIGAAMVHPTSRFPARILVEAWDEEGIDALRRRCVALRACTGHPMRGMIFTIAHRVEDNELCRSTMITTAPNDLGAR